MSRQKTVTVSHQYGHTRADGTITTQAVLKLRGRTISDVFPIGSKLRAVRQLQAGRVVLVLEIA